MPQTPEGLSEIIRHMAQQAARSRKRTLDRLAEDRISKIPVRYQSEKTIPVDLRRLEMIIEDIVKIAASSVDRSIGLSAMESALDRVECHYLWFC